MRDDEHPETMQPQYSLGTADGVWGPYSIDEINSFAREGILDEAYYVWDHRIEAWVAWKEFLVGENASDTGINPPEATDSSILSGNDNSLRDPLAPDPPPYLCRDHHRAAAAHCALCHALLCADDIRFSGNSITCESCRPNKTPVAPDDLQARVTGVFGRLYHEQRVGVAIVFVIAVILFSGTRGTRNKASAGMPGGMAETYWTQSNRALIRANALTLSKNPDRARSWFTLADEAAKNVLADPSVAAGIKEQALCFRMRIAVDLENHAALPSLIAEYESTTRNPTRRDDLNFFKGCALSLNAEDDSAAMTKFIDAQYGSSDDQIGTMINVYSQGTIQAREKAMLMFEKTFTSAELNYRMGLCAERLRPRRPRVPKENEHLTWDKYSYAMMQTSEYYFQLAAASEETSPSAQIWTAHAREKLGR